MSYRSQLTLKDKLLDFFFNTRYNTLTVAQARARFGVETQSVTSAVRDLRMEGFAIYTNTKVLSDGRRIKFYRLGNPSARYTRNLNAGRTRLAVKSLYSVAA